MGPTQGGDVWSGSDGAENLEPLSLRSPASQWKQLVLQRPRRPAFSRHKPCENLAGVGAWRGCSSYSSPPASPVISRAGSQHVGKGGQVQRLTQEELAYAPPKLQDFLGHTEKPGNCVWEQSLRVSDPAEGVPRWVGSTNGAPAAEAEWTAPAHANCQKGPQPRAHLVKATWAGRW